MSATCMREELGAWERRGEAAVEALDRHLESCDECAREHAAIVDVRRRLEALPVRRIDPERLGAMRFDLIAAARKRPASPASERPAPPSAGVVRAARQTRSWRIPALLAAAVGLIALSLVLAYPRGRPPSGAPEVAEIELADGATGVRAHDGPDQVFALLRGRAQFHVRHLQGGERFRVVAGGDTVEVKGTRFGVEVDEGRMIAVEVQEGAVLLTLAGGETHLLPAGESWRRATAVGGLPRATAMDAREGDAPEGAASAAADPVASTAAAHAGDAAHPVARRAPDHEAAPPPSATPSATASIASFDAEFGQALELLKKGRASEAAAAFDALRGNAAVDPGRRADALYWAARAHKEAGHAAAAEERARLAAETPGSWHAEDAALMLGEALMRRGDVAGARPLLERAARSERESVRVRAERALKGAVPAPASP